MLGGDFVQVLQIANGYYDSKLYELLFSALSARGVENHVFVPLKQGQSPQVGTDFFAVPCFTQLDRMLFFKKQRKMLRTMEKYIDMGQIEMVHAHTLFSGGYAAYRLNRTKGIPYIVAIRNTDLNVFFKYMVHLRHVGVEIMRHAERIIFLAPSYQRAMLEKYVPRKYVQQIRKRSIIIPNGISNLFFAAVPQPKHLKPGAVRLIYVGEVSTNKNLEQSIQAAELLRRKGLDVSLTVVGDILEEKYRGMMASHDFIRYFPRCPQEIIIDYLRESDIFVMPSHTETFGLVYAEAMSQGVPVIYTRGQGFDGQFPEGTVGYAVSDRDPEEQALAISSILKNYEDISRNCLRFACKFDWNRIAEQYTSVYKESEENRQ